MMETMAHSSWPIAFNPEVVRALGERELVRIKMEPIRLQPPFEEDPTPPDHRAPPDPLPPYPFWQCVTLLDHYGCGAIWLRERKVGCACGGYVARVEHCPETWPKL